MSSKYRQLVLRETVLSKGDRYKFDPELELSIDWLARAAVVYRRSAIKNHEHDDS